MKADAFYNILRTEEEGIKIMSFDCQKNWNLPKLPDQSAYFLRQTYLYNFTICEGLSTNHQKQNNTFIYKWLESVLKGSSQIASAVFHQVWRPEQK